MFWPRGGQIVAARAVFTAPCHVKTNQEDIGQKQELIVTAKCVTL
jgi:hypothetical protein